MHQRRTTTPHIADLARVVWKYRLRWSVPIVLATVAALAYAVWFYRPDWEATQALLVRDEAVGSPVRPGRFLDQQDRATLQETVLQLAASYAVVEEALDEIGPPEQRKVEGPWPTPEEVDRTQGRIAVRAPGGAEFGRTEVFHLKVRHPDRKRAIALASALCDRVEAELKRLRSQRAQSLIDELTRSEALARNELNAVTSELAEVERQVGGDLPELRMLTEIGSGTSHLQQTQIDIENELRRVRADQQTWTQLEQLLVAAIGDPTELVATPDVLLQSQPALEQLKAGLVAAQLRSAQLLGGMSATHPQISAAREAENEIRGRLNAELEVALRGVRTQLQTAANRRALLEEQLADVQQRLVLVAGVRAPYANLLDRRRRRDEILARAERDLADARSSLAAAASASLISRVDVPRTGNHPVGPRRAHLLAGGLAGGLLAGIGLLFLTVPAEDLVPATARAAAPSHSLPARRQTDHPMRRKTDRVVTTSVWNMPLHDFLIHVTGQSPSNS